MKVIEIKLKSDTILDIGGYIVDLEFKEKSLVADIKSNDILVDFLEKGEDGKTPIKGVDYFTEIDKLELIENIYINSDVEPIVGIEIDNLFN